MAKMIIGSQHNRDDGIRFFLLFHNLFHNDAGYPLLLQESNTNGADTKRVSEK